MAARRQPPRDLDLHTLNPRQLEAVMHTHGPLLVLAGAGSGKTRVIIYRIARLMLDGTSPDRVLGVTFTNKSAKEMRERLKHLVGRNSAKVRLSTFHSLGLAILKEEYAAAGLRQGFTIYDTNDQLSLVRDMMRRVKVADRRLDTAKVLDVLLKTKRLGLSEVALDWGDDYELAAYDLYPRYLAQMRAFNAIDFDDLILKSRAVLEVPDVRRRWAGRYDFVLVDEYQDTSPDQLSLVRVLCGPDRNLCVVGDDDQSIYAWRGADVGNILAFGKHFHGASEVVLDQNYRSTGNILNVANAVIQNNVQRKSKKLWSAGGDGHPVEVVACHDGDDEANLVVEEIHKLLYGGVKHDDIAVLYRSNAQSRIFEETLGLEHLPYRVVGGQAFFDRKEVRDAVIYLSVCHNPRNEVALRRIINVPPRGIGPATVEKLTAFGESTGDGLWGALVRYQEVPGLNPRTVSGISGLLDVMKPAVEQVKFAPPGQLGDRVRSMFDMLRLRDSVVSADDAPSIAARRLENLDETVNAIARADERFTQENPGVKGNGLADFLSSSSLERSSADGEPDTKGLITLMTLHSSKGLEFPYVFFVGFEEDTLPHRKTVEMDGDLSEERRLCYVGITRAKIRLWMTYANNRMMRGKPEPRGPSRFLEEFPKDDSNLRRKRSEPVSEEDNDKMAEDFFAKMRAQLGIDDDEE